MIVFARAGPPVEWGKPYGNERNPLTWRPVVPHPERPKSLDAVALATCANGHECSISPGVHTVAADGTLHPSYVCPVAACGFHVWARLDGWTP